VCDLETSRMGAPYIYDISRLRVNEYSRNAAASHWHENPKNRRQNQEHISWIRKTAL